MIISTLVGKYLFGKICICSIYKYPNSTGHPDLVSIWSKCLWT